jgi:hypothetical protein
VQLFIANTIGHKFSGSVLNEQDNEVIPKIREKENRNKIIANYELSNDRVNNHSKLKEGFEKIRAQPEGQKLQSYKESRNRMNEYLIEHIDNE